MGEAQCAALAHYVCFCTFASELLSSPQNSPLRITTLQEVSVITVMPCFDKKLEASRDDFFNAQVRHMHGLPGQ
eukprot:scaffold298903_cov32-Tisochrysis_lutea.AAC.4